jgi:hypothetical protein
MSDTDMLCMASLQKRLADIEAENTELKARIAELEDKHWNECRQIAHYDDELSKYQKEMPKIVEYINYLRSLPVNRWISVDDKLPIEHGPVLCYARSTTGEGNFRILGTLRNGEFWFLQVDGTQFSFPNLCLEVTHWMPLPEPPKE